MQHTIKQFKSPRGCLSYVVSDKETGDALIIDPSEEIDTSIYLTYLKEHGLTLRYILETHTHADHISSSAVVCEKTGARILQHHHAPTKRKDDILPEGELKLGTTTITIFHTPGHTNDSLCLYVPGAVFTGDTLLLGGTGRTDFQEGSSEALYESIWNKLMALPQDTTVYPGHSYTEKSSSTIKEERTSNARVTLSKQEFIKALDAHHPAKPDLFDEAIEKNSA